MSKNLISFSIRNDSLADLSLYRQTQNTRFCCRIRVVSEFGVAAQQEFLS